MYRLFYVPAQINDSAVPYVPTQINDRAVVWIQMSAIQETYVSVIAFFSSSLVLPVYFSHRFIQAVSASFQNRFSTWLGLYSMSGPTHKTLPLSPEAQLTWHDNALAAHSFRQEKQMREICPSFSTTPGLKPPRSLWMLWPALYLALSFASSLPKPSELLLKRDAVEIEM